MFTAQKHFNIPITQWRDRKTQLVSHFGIPTHKEILWKNVKDMNEQAEQVS